MSLILVDNASSIKLQHITLLLQNSQELLTLEPDATKRKVSVSENVSLKQWMPYLYISGQLGQRISSLHTRLFVRNRGS